MHALHLTVVTMDGGSAVQPGRCPPHVRFGIVTPRSSPATVDTFSNIGAAGVAACLDLVLTRTRCRLLDLYDFDRPSRQDDSGSRSP